MKFHENTEMEKWR